MYVHQPERQRAIGVCSLQRKKEGKMKCDWCSFLVYVSVSVCMRLPWFSWEKQRLSGWCSSFCDAVAPHSVSCVELTGLLHFGWVACTLKCFSRFFYVCCVPLCFCPVCIIPFSLVLAHEQVKDFCPEYRRRRNKQSLAGWLAGNNKVEHAEIIYIV